MRVLRRETYSVGRADEFRIYPLGDIHLGAAACDEDKFKRLVERIASEPTSKWIGMGDYADFINRSDPKATCRCQPHQSKLCLDLWPTRQGIAYR